MDKLNGPVDRMRQEKVSLELEHGSKHPVQLIQEGSRRDWHQKLDTVRRTYGSHLAMRLATEKESLSRMRRLPGLEFSNIGLQTIMGNDDKIDFADYLDDPFMRPTIPKLEVHGQLEIKFGLL